jgi:hypothetical protein
MGVPGYPMGIGMGIPQGIHGYEWVSMGIFAFKRKSAVRYRLNISALGRANRPVAGEGLPLVF